MSDRVFTRDIAKPIYVVVSDGPSGVCASAVTDKDAEHPIEHNWCLHPDCITSTEMYTCRLELWWHIWWTHASYDGKGPHELFNSFACANPGCNRKSNLRFFQDKCGHKPAPCSTHATLEELHRYDMAVLKSIGITRSCSRVIQTSDSL